MKRARVDTVSLTANRDAAIWNAFIDLVATSEPTDLAPEQRPSQLVFCYESEVENGGHLQYFLNRGPTEAQAAIEALILLGAQEHARSLTAALNVWHSRQRTPPTDAEAFVDEALELEFEPYDDAFPSYTSLQVALEKHLGEHLEVFVDLGAA